MYKKNLFFVSNPDGPLSHCIGKMTFKLKKYNFDLDSPEKIETLYYPIYSKVTLECVNTFTDNEDGSYYEIRYKMIFGKE